LVLALLTPVVSAISYLHRQEPPIVHRDIKPSNMIVPVGAGEAMLVDFGIAKEYVEEKTTSMFRYGTPGYAAPEQYGQGTTQRTDIYALGATFYALLTGAIPIDALVRSVGSGELQDHTLKPAHEVNPDISEAVSAVIERAMQLRKEDRYASVDEFWQELNSAALQQEDISSFADMSTAPIVVMPQDAKRPVVIKAARRPVAVRGRILIAAIAILFVLGLGVGAFALYNNNSPVAKKATVHVTRVALPLTMSVAGCPLPAFTPVPPVAPQYIQTAPAYLGRISDNVAQVSTQNQGTALCLADVRQNGAHITGKFSGLGYISTFKGTVTQDKVEFTVLIGSDRTYTFTGGIRSVGDMAGSYQVVDSAGQSMGESGIWQLVPQQPHTAA
jgi:hypothetical protein